MDNESHGALRMKSLERIRGHIPGFPGYADPATRMEADAVFRSHMEGMISSVSGRLEEYVHSSAAEKRLDLLSDFEDILEILDGLRTDMAAEVVRDPGKWASVPLSEEQLIRTHENDEDLADAVQLLHDRVTGLSDPVPERAEVLLLKNAVERIQGRFRDRCNNLEELGLVGEAHSG